MRDRFAQELSVDRFAVPISGIVSPQQDYNAALVINLKPLLNKTPIPSSINQIPEAFPIVQGVQHMLG